MSNAKEYRQHAQECLDAAQRLQNEEDKAIALRIAERWICLAEEQGALSSSTEPAQQPQQVQPKDDKTEEGHFALRSRHHRLRHFPGRRWLRDQSRSRL
jgi:hypothetical protein